MPVSAEGRVEHQKQNQTATSQWPVGFVFGVQLDYSCRKKSDPAYAENRVGIQLSFSLNLIVDENLYPGDLEFYPQWEVREHTQ